MRSYLSVYWMMYTMLLTSLTIQHTVYILSLPTYTSPRTIRIYVAKSQGHRRHVGWYQSSRSEGFTIVHMYQDSFRNSLSQWVYTLVYLFFLLPLIHQPLPPLPIQTYFCPNSSKRGGHWTHTHTYSLSYYYIILRRKKFYICLYWTFWVNSFFVQFHEIKSNPTSIKEIQKLQSCEILFYSRKKPRRWK